MIRRYAVIETPEVEGRAGHQSWLSLPDNTSSPFWGREGTRMEDIKSLPRYNDSHPYKNNLINPTPIFR